VVKSFIASLFLSFGLLGSACAQQNDDNYERELTYGINFNTNAGVIGGASFRSAHVKTANRLNFWGVEAVEVKHPKESRYLGQRGDVFVRGKINYLFVVRPEYGHEYIFFRKAAESGVEVNGILGIGPSLGLLVPYYIDYDVNKTRQGGAPGQLPNVQRVRYDPIGAHAEYDYIVGGAGVLAGLGETDVKFGAHIRAAMSFEYGRYHESIAGVETGFMLEAYPHKLIMLPEAQNYAVFNSVYLTIYYGRRK
jgi:hypothetical protein